jgi:dipeptidyl aminopeptidase/acylaminoacyl peptidase
VADYEVTVMDLHGQKRVLSRGWRAEGGLAWGPTENEIWFSGTKLGGDPALHAVTTGGKERTVVETPAWMVVKDIIRDGRLLVTVEDSRIGISSLAVPAKQERDLSWFDASWVYDISTDGGTILFVELSSGKARNTAIYLRRTDGSPAIALGDGNRPALSPDSKSVACIFSDGPQTTLKLIPTGAGEVKTIPANGIHYAGVEWFPDGQRLLLVGSEANKKPRTFVLDLRGGKPTPITPEGTQASAVSPDQQYVTVSGNGTLSLLPIAGGESKKIADLDPGESMMRWSGDGHALFLQRVLDPSAIQIVRLDVATGRKEPWKELKTPDPVGVQILHVVMTPDGKSYAYSFQRDISTLYLAEGLK